jgi:SAM-dependent methyltransferase
MTTTTRMAAGAYDDFAPFYDAFTAASDYELWTTHVLALARAHGFRGATVLDVACGTGKSFLPMLERGFDVTGADASPAMLVEAARKAPDVPLVEADVRALPRLGRFDLVTCFDDSLNHLLDEDALAAALTSLGANLGAEGLLLFDLNSLLTYRSTFAVHTVTERDGTVFAWRGAASAGAPPGGRAVARIDVFAPREEDGYERVGVEFEQRHFEPHRVTALLAAAGLECLGVYGVSDDGSHEPEVDETVQLKVMYVAKLAKGGERG